MGKKPIKFATPDVGRKELHAIKKVIDSGWLTHGPVVREFEKKIAMFSGCNRAVAFDSCTAAMEITLRALGIGPGDEVITTPYTYSATAEVIRNVGAKIVFVDLDGDSFEMDYEKMADAITERTKAVMPVDIGGKLCDYEKIFAAVESKSSIFKPENALQKALGRPAVIADAAHSFLANRWVGFNSRFSRIPNLLVSGEFADFTCFSFHVLKGITTGGEGGAVVWKDIDGVDNDELEQTIRLVGDHGQTSRDKSKGWEYDIRLFGLNHIMTNVDAAMGLAQLDRWEKIYKARIDVTKRYDDLFEYVQIKPLIDHFEQKYDLICCSAFHLYPVEISGPAKTTDDDSFRNEIYWKMAENGIPCNVHYKPLPMMTAYKNAGYRIEDYPNAYSMFCRVLTIPYHTKLTLSQQVRVTCTLKESIERGWRG